MCACVYYVWYISLIVKVHSVNSRAIYIALCFPGVRLLPVTFTCEVLSSPRLSLCILLWLLRCKEPVPLQA